MLRSIGTLAAVLSTFAGGALAQSAFHFPVPASPDFGIDLALGHLDGDTFVDLVAAHPTDDLVKIGRGSGDGRFVEVGSLSVSDPRHVELGDVDCDGELDIAVTSLNGKSVYFARGVGGYHFQSSSSVTHGSFVRDFALADLDADGDLDLVSTEATNAVDVWLNDGAGNFQLSASMWAPQSPWRIQVADLDDDGTLDVLAVFLHAVAAYLGGGDGTFAPALLSRTISPTYGRVAVADYDGDGFADLAIGDDSRRLGFYRGNGLGWFAPWSHIDLSFDVYTLTQDFDGDGRFDLLVVSPFANWSLTVPDVHVWRNVGGSHFVLNQVVPLGSPMFDFESGDLNADGRLDWLVAQWTYPAAYLQRSDTTLQAPSAVRYAIGAGYTQNIDLDEDGSLDLLVLSFASDGARSLLQKSPRAFTQVNTFPAGFDAPDWALVGRIDGDAHVDLVYHVVTQPSYPKGTLIVAPGNGDGTFGAAVTSVEWPLGLPLEIADFDGDGDDDVLATSYKQQGFKKKSTLVVHFASNDGTLAPGAHQFEGLDVAKALATDLDGDGDFDVIAMAYDIQSGVTSLRLLVNDGSGTFAAGAVYSTSIQSAAPARLADFDGNGALDLARVGSTPNVGLEVRLADGSGGLLSPTYLPLDEPTQQLHALDFDGDGHIDVLTDLAAGFAVHRGRGDGTFHPAAIYSTCNASGGILGVDMDSDGLGDVATFAACKRFTLHYGTTTGP